VRVESARLSKLLTEMGNIGKRQNFKGVTRLALTEEDGKARDQLIRWMEELDLKISIDSIGNIFGLRKGSKPDLKPVIMGSHLDTVIDAGIYDGAYGVIGALEVIKRITDEGLETIHSLGIGCFTNEEGVRFHPDMMGSLVKAGGYPLEKAYEQKDDDGITVKEALQKIGYIGSDNIDPEAYFELHIEQGPILHRNGIQIGVVEGVQGIAWWGMHLRGEANHAGTTPLNMRRDAMEGAANIYRTLLDSVKRRGNAVCTMGKLNLEPNAINVVPGLADFTIDYRSYDDTTFKEGKTEVERIANEVSQYHNLSLEMDMLADAKPIHFQPNMVELVENQAKRRSYSTLRLPSGAGHDAQFMNSICPTAMIFIPSINGISHNPNEKSKQEDLESGVNVLLSCALSIAGIKS
jgi:beta-ureidopropionase / N-carbamoyl-L-amino-acid hydrolase